MARTTNTLVKDIMETALSDAQIDAIIPMASRMVDDNLASSDLSTATLTDIETWLTAHLIAMGKERQAEEERVNDIWITYQGNFGEGLKSTTFGQMVLILDTTGSFASLIKMKASIRSIPQYPENYD